MSDGESAVPKKVAKLDDMMANDIDMEEVNVDADVMDDDGQHTTTKVSRAPHQNCLSKMNWSAHGVPPIQSDLQRQSLKKFALVYFI